MNPAGRSRVAITFRIRKLGLLGAMVVLAAAYTVAPLPATATPIDYSLSDASATFTSPPGTIMLTGTFVFDPSGPTLVSSDISATGSTSVLPGAPETFTTADPMYATGPETFGICSVPGCTGGDYLLLVFSNPLSTTPDTISAIYAAPYSEEIAPEASTVTGSAIPVAAPEPPSLTLLAGGSRSLSVCALGDPARPPRMIGSPGRGTGGLLPARPVCSSPKPTIA